MGVRLWSRWARGPVRSAGIDPAQKPVRDAQAARTNADLSERDVFEPQGEGPGAQHVDQPGEEMCPRHAWDIAESCGAGGLK
jgi:hypothetical protein